MGLRETYLENLIKRKGQQYDQENGAIYSEAEYEVGLDENGKPVSSHALHQVILMIIDEFKRVCDKHNIPFALGFGSALGMYNYKGFIPWDDDADLVVSVDDLPRLAKALEEDLSDDFTFESYESDKRYLVLNPSMKIRYKHSYIKEANSFFLPNRCKNGSGIFIDICAFSNVPGDLKTHTRLRRNALWTMPYYCFLDGVLRIHPYLTKKRLKRFEKKVNDKYRGSGYVSQSIIIAWQAFNKDKTKILYPYDMIYPFVEREFEGRMYPFFHDVEGFLRRNYGDIGLRRFEDGEWRETYPEEKRKIRHIKKISIYEK